MFVLFWVFLLEVFVSAKKKQIQHVTASKWLKVAIIRVTQEASIKIIDMGNTVVFIGSESINCFILQLMYTDETKLAFSPPGG